MSRIFKKKQTDFCLTGKTSHMATPYDQLDAHRTVANRLGMSLWLKLKPAEQEYFKNVVLRRAS